MAAFALKVKMKSGQQVLRSLTGNSTLADLKAQLMGISGIEPQQQQVLFGFPPKVLDTSLSDKSTLSSCGLLSGETIILEEKPAGSTVVRDVAFGTPGRTTTTTSSSTSDHPAVDKQTKSVTINETPAIREASFSTVGSFDSSNSAEMTRGILMKHVVPADNSCLFTSIHYVLNGREDVSGTMMPELRQLVAQTIERETDQYCEAVLGKSTEEYCRWITDPSSWGGAIEIAVFSHHFGIEIAVVDTVNAIINRFGEDYVYGTRVFLLFDGIHYDPLYLESLDGGETLTIFRHDDMDVMRQAEEIAKEAQSSRQFTDVNNFKLSCKVCDVKFLGQTEAVKHAKETGHSDFGEI